MEFRKILTLRGPNYWANFPVLEVWVDLKELKDASSEELPGFNDRLKAWLPTMIEHRCSEGVRGGFFERLRRGTYQAHILEHVTLELQSLAGCDVGFGRARETAEEGVYKVAIEYMEEEVARAALHAGRELCLAAIDDRPFDVTAEVGKLRDLLHKVALGPSTASIAAAARTRGVPSRRLNSGSLVMLGHAARQRRILTAESDRTSAIAESIAQDKDLTRGLLRAVGVPVPEGRPVDSAEDAWEAAELIGGAVVVKPRYGNQGRGVATDLRDREQVLAAYQAARCEGPDIVVEKFAPGSDYRLLVVGDRLVAASRREPAQVIGDGVSTVASLVEVENRYLRRSDGHATALSRIKLDAIALAVLAEQGHSASAVPAAGERVLIRRNANLSTGGTAIDVTDDVHPDVALRAIDAARIIGLDIAGIDVVALDIARPLEEQGGVVVEVNAGPGLRMHLEPSSGTPRAVGEAIVDSLFPDGQDGRIPIVGVTGVNGKTTTTRLVAHILGKAGHTVGMTCTDGIYVAGRRIDTGDCSGPKSARAILLNPRVDAAVLETARGGILREGLGFDRCDVAIVTNIGEGDHLGLADIDTLEKLARVKATLVRAVAPTGSAVLKADDPLVVDMAGNCPGSIVFFARDGLHPVVVEHRSKGGRAAFVREGLIVLAEGADEEVLIPLTRVPLTFQGRIGFQVENVLAAAAAAWSLGVPFDAIRTGFETFINSLSQTPGRFNVLHAGGACMILDYGHNPSAVEALIGAINEFPHRRRTAVFSAAGDRRDEDILRQGEMLGNAFDHVVIFEDQCNRGRPEGEVVALLRQGLGKGKRVAGILETRGERNAIELAFKTLRAGDLLLVQTDLIDETLSIDQERLAAILAANEVEFATDSPQLDRAARHPHAIEVATAGARPVLLQG